MTIKKLLDKIDSLFPIYKEDQTAEQIAEDMGKIEILVKLVEWINQETTIVGWTEEERSEKRQEVTQTEEKRGFTDSDIVNGLME